VQDGGRASRAETNAERGDNTRRPQCNLTGELTSEQQVRLTLDGAIRVEPLESIAEMNNQFGTPVRQYGLDFVPSTPFGFEGPNTLDDRHQRRNRSELAKLHR
jgi:hypothetical protein